ncbi:hypothetical protein FACS1894186_7400 [Alphaproteobacteria bacterium]|nr:hypothetical protein FACS1894186_7400 [Alphaproteobacteria bacterium]
MAFLSACASSSTPSGGGGEVGHYKVGRPYTISGIQYTPRVQDDYDEVGQASWYGPQFHNGATANGETFDMHSMTAAHKTLPLPSVVRVENLSTGKTVVLRVNDRGPFVGSRIIDVSQKAAEVLGFRNKGLQKVRVRVLPEESYKARQEAMARNGAAKGTPPLKRPDFAESRTPPEPTYFAEQDLEEVAALAPASESRVAETALPPPASAGAAIQVGAFANRANAETLAESLGASVSAVAAGGQTLWRVRMGGFASDFEASAALRRIRSSGFPNAKIVSEQ